jgi:hypothetical protein
MAGASVEVQTREGGTRQVEVCDSARWPAPGLAWEAWAESLGGYPSGGLERAAAQHEQELRRAGWRFVSEEWTPPPRRRHAVDAVAGRVRALVVQLDMRRPPAHTVGEACGALAGCIQALAGLLFYPTAEEALRELSDPRLVAKMLRQRRQHEPLRARFGSVGAVLVGGRAPVLLGAGSSGYEVAQSRGRTRARWNEVFCQPSHGGSAGVRGLPVIEAALDRDLATRRVKLDQDQAVAAALWAGLRTWLVEKAKREERVVVFRRALAMQRGASEIQTTTADWTDRAILARLTRARESLIEQLQVAPARAADLAAATGDTAYLAPLVRIAERDKPERRHRQRRERSAALVTSLERCA